MTALADRACPVFAGWDPDDEAEGDAIDDAIDGAIEELGLDRFAVWKLIGIDVLH